MQGTAQTMRQTATGHNFIALSASRDGVPAPEMPEWVATDENLKKTSPVLQSSTLLAEMLRGTR
jgi:hypothetical protein